MKSMIKCEEYKLYKDKQIRIIVGFIIFYLTIKFIFSEKPSFYVSGSVGEWMADATIDSAFMAMLVSLVASAIFAAEYSYKTYKNIIPYVKKRRLFEAKIVTNAVSIFIILIIWYIFGLIIAIIKSTNSLTFQDLLFSLYKFCTQYLMILAHSGLLILISVVFHSRTITNISTVLLWFCYSFIPINGKKIFDYIVYACIWGTKPNYMLCLCLLLLFCICTFISNIIFNKQEVRA